MPTITSRPPAVPNDHTGKLRHAEPRHAEPRHAEPRHAEFAPAEPPNRPTGPAGIHSGGAPRRGRAAALPTVHRPTRLTHRGRLGVVVVLALLIAAGFSLGRASRSAGSVPPPAYQHTVVQPGQTLWSIARRVAPDRDPRETVAVLEALNNVPDGVLTVGQPLLLPARAR